MSKGCAKCGAYFSAAVSECELIDVSDTLPTMVKARHTISTLGGYHLCAKCGESHGARKQLRPLCESLSCGCKRRSKRREDCEGAHGVDALSIRHTQRGSALIAHFRPALRQPFIGRITGREKFPDALTVFVPESVNHPRCFLTTPLPTLHVLGLVDRMN